MSTLDKCGLRRSFELREYKKKLRFAGEALVETANEERIGDKLKKQRMENDDETYDGILNLNGVSPDEWDSQYDEVTEGDVCDTEEPALFPSPSRVLGDVRRADNSVSDERFSKLLFCDNEQLAIKDCDRSQHVSGAVTRLRSLGQLENLLCSAPLVINGHCDSPSSLLWAGETVLVVLHNGGNSEILPQRATEELSKCRIFCLDLGELPQSEYGDADDDTAVRSNGNSGCGDSAGFLRLPATDGLLSLATQTTRRCMKRVLRRAGSILCLNETSCPGDTGVADTQSPDKCGALTLPMLAVWRAEGGPLDEYPEKMTHAGDNAGEHVASFVAAGTLHGRLLQAKHITSVDQLHCFSLLMPVYTLPHLLRTLFKTTLSPLHLDPKKIISSRSLIYFGASWCPPCMRIVNALPAMMQGDFPDNLTCVVKADMDLATPLFEFFGVEIIPTFVIFDNDILREAGDWDALFSPSCSEDSLRQLYAGLQRSELGRIQNSQRLSVRTFLEKHSGTLRFDEDF